MAARSCFFGDRRSVTSSFLSKQFRPFEVGLSFSSSAGDAAVTHVILRCRPTAPRRCSAVGVPLKLSDLGRVSSSSFRSCSSASSRESASLRPPGEAPLHPGSSHAESSSVARWTPSLLSTFSINAHKALSPFSSHTASLFAVSRRFSRRFHTSRSCHTSASLSVSPVSSVCRSSESFAAVGGPCWTRASSSRSRHTSRWWVSASLSVFCETAHSASLGESGCIYSRAPAVLLSPNAYKLVPSQAKSRSFSLARTSRANGADHGREDGRASEGEVPLSFQESPKPRIPTLCLGVSVHRDVIGYALIQPKSSWLPLKVGFIDPAGAPQSLPDQAAEVAGVLLALRDQQHRLLSHEGEPGETSARHRSHQPPSWRARDEEAGAAEEGRPVASKGTNPQKRCFWIVGIEEALRVPQSFREATRAAALQQLKGAISADLLKIFSVSSVVPVEPKQARAALARVAGVPLGSRQETFSWLSEQVPSFPSHLRREEAALTMADAWLVAVHAQRIVEAMRLRERLRGVLTAEFGKQFVKDCGAAQAMARVSTLPPHLMKLADTLRVPSGRVVALRQAAAEAPDVRTRRELLQVLKSRQESELTQAIERHLDAQYQSARGRFLAPGQLRVPPLQTEARIAVEQSGWRAAGGPRISGVQTPDGASRDGAQNAVSAVNVANEEWQKGRRVLGGVRELESAELGASTRTWREEDSAFEVSAEAGFPREEAWKQATGGSGRSERQASLEVVAAGVAAANAKLQAARTHRGLHEVGGDESPRSKDRNAANVAPSVGPHKGKTDACEANTVRKVCGSSPINPYLPSRDKATLGRRKR
ncbi:UNVERIFIED_CONTAM: hypothetical protein HHA_250090 [Hammondia hammondi]|eukprot:XP_008888660.1 hypothetical protein HHA_250090 [Hammondia hammondi]